MHLIDIADWKTGVTAARELAEHARWEEALALLGRLNALASDPVEQARLKIARVETMNDLDWTRGLREAEVKHTLLDEAMTVVAGDAALEALVEFQRGMSLHLEFIMSTGDPAREVAAFQRAADLFEQVGDVEGCALATSFVGIFHHVDRLDRDAAYPVLRKAYDMAPKGRGSEALSEAARHLGQIHHERGDFAAAIPFLEESLAARAESGDARHLPSALHALGYVYLESGNLDRAEEYLNRAERLGRQYDSQLFLAMVHKAQADLDLRRIFGPNLAGRTHP